MSEVQTVSETTIDPSVVQRLRESRDKHKKSEYQDGWRCGQKWVTRGRQGAAEFVELRNLENLLNDEHAATCFEEGDSSYTSAEAVFFAIDPSEDGVREAASDFWESVTGFESETALDPEFVRGFVEGAVDVWLKVKDEL